jgi:hypothetical protein
MENWLELTVEDTKDQLIERLGVSERNASDIAITISHIDPRLRNEFSKFWSNKPFDGGLEIEGWSYDKLISHFGFKPIGGWTTLDWLCRDPAAAKAALKYGIR